MQPSRRVICFSDYEIDVGNAVLRRGESVIKLPPQPFKVLACLASRPNQLVTREELRQAIWGDEVVVDFEHGLNTCIRQIRTALGDQADHPQFIETVPRLGYRFRAVPSSPEAPTPVPSRRVAAVQIALAVLALVATYPMGRAIMRQAVRDDASRPHLPNARVGAAYVFKLGMYPSLPAMRIVNDVPAQITGWAATGLPPGLAVDFEGNVEGLPTADGTYLPTFVLMHRVWTDVNGNRVPDCDLSVLLPNSECGAASTTNPLRMSYTLTVVR